MANSSKNKTILERKTAPITAPEERATVSAKRECNEVFCPTDQESQITDKAAKEAEQRAGKRAAAEEQAISG